MRKLILVLMVLVAVPAAVPAHYNMLLLSAPLVERGKEVTLTYQWGHPFEHELFDAPRPESLIAIAPDGTKRTCSRSSRKSA